MADFKNIVLWKNVKNATLALYIISLVIFPFSQIFSTLLIFSIIVLWSRCLCMLNYYAKDLDVLDIFAVVVSINLGGIFGFFFVFINMLSSRLFGPTEELNYLIKDTVGMSFAALMTPFMFQITGQNILLTVYLFTVQRYIYYLIQTMLFEPQMIGSDFTYMMIGIPIAYFMNTIIVKVFGNGIDEIMKNGSVLTKELFIFTTVIIAIIYFSSWYLQKKKVKEEEEKEIEYYNSSNYYEQEKQKIINKKWDYESIPEPHEVIILLTESSRDGFIISNSDRDFRIIAVILLSVLFLIRSFVLESVPSSIEIILIILFFIAVVSILLSYLNWFNQLLKKLGDVGIIHWFLISVSFLFVVMLVM